MIVTYSSGKLTLFCYYQIIDVLTFVTFVTIQTWNVHTKKIDEHDTNRILQQLYTI